MCSRPCNRNGGNCISRGSVVLDYIKHFITEDNDTDDMKGLVNMLLQN